MISVLFNSSSQRGERDCREHMLGQMMAKENKMQEKKQILIAHPNETICKGISAIVREDSDHPEVYEVATGEELQAQMEQRHFDLMILHQSFVTSAVTLTPGHFVLLATEPTIEMFAFARLQGALAYLMENTPRNLLQQTLHLVPGTFLTDPVINRWLSEYLTHHLLFSLNDEVLTDREREVFRLLWSGLGKREIAEQLKISEPTVRTHITHIHEKFKLNRYKAKMLVLLLPESTE